MPCSILPIWCQAITWTKVVPRSILCRNPSKNPSISAQQKYVWTCRLQNPIVLTCQPLCCQSYNIFNILIFCWYIVCVCMYITCNAPHKQWIVYETLTCVSMYVYIQYICIHTCIYSSVKIYRKVSNIKRTKSQNWNEAHLVLKSSLPNPLKPGVKSRMKM